MEDKFDIWQYSNKGQVNGIEGDVDMNIYLQKKWYDRFWEIRKVMRWNLQN